jgi:hypothetical protein
MREMPGLGLRKSGFSDGMQRKIRGWFDEEQMTLAQRGPTGANGEGREEK